MKILVLNAGSSSLKYQLIDMSNEKVIVKGLCERINVDGRISQKNIYGKEFSRNEKLNNHTDAMHLILESITNKEYGVISSLNEIDAIGHRVLHSAEEFNDSVLITNDVIKICENNIELGPLHMPANISCIKSCKKLLPNTPMVAVFDTTFHSTIPEKAYLYGIKYEDYEQYRVRKYGFHGSSHKFVSNATINFLKKKKSKLIICHLGNGSSLSAVKDGVCVDTTMGFTPLAGVVMGTRAGDIDVSAVEFLRNKKNRTAPEMIDYLNRECGMLGISGLSSDMRDLEASMGNNKRAKLAIEIAAYSIKKYIGSFMAILNGIDAIVFTGGIGENSSVMREMLTKDLDNLGILLDEKKNLERSNEIRDISSKQSRVKILIVPTNEELLIAQETVKIIQK